MRFLLVQPQTKAQRRTDVGVDPGRERTQAIIAEQCLSQGSGSLDFGVKVWDHAPQNREKPFIHFAFV